MSPRLPVSTLFLAGVLTLAVLVSGCADSSGGGTTGITATTSASGSLAAVGAASMYALDDTSTTTTTIANDVLEFPAASSGTSTVPAVTIPLGTLVPTGVALDGSGFLYVAGLTDTTGVPSVNVYVAGATSNASPLRTFSLNAAFEPVGIVVSSAGQAYVLKGE